MLVMTIESLIPRLLPVVTKWKEVGEALSLDEDYLDEIFTNNETDEECLQAMLELYFNNSDFDHSWKEIERAVVSVSEVDGEVQNLIVISTHRGMLCSCNYPSPACRFFAASYMYTIIIMVVSRLYVQCHVCCNNNI